MHKRRLYNPKPIVDNQQQQQQQQNSHCPYHTTDHSPHPYNLHLSTLCPVESAGGKKQTRKMLVSLSVITSLSFSVPFSVIYTNQGYQGLYGANSKLN